MTYGVKMQFDGSQRIEEFICEIAQAAINTALDREMKTGEVRFSLEIEGAHDATEDIPVPVRLARRKDSLYLSLRPRGQVLFDEQGLPA